MEARAESDFSRNRLVPFACDAGARIRSPQSELPTHDTRRRLLSSRSLSASAGLREIMLRALTLRTKTNTSPTLFNFNVEIEDGVREVLR